MNLTVTEYREYFSDLCSCINVIDSNLLKHLPERETTLLSKYGLPSQCIEVFDFDSIPTVGQDEKLEDALFIFGSIYESLEESFLFIDHKYAIKLLIDEEVMQVNQSLDQFFDCIMTYIKFIDTINARNSILGNNYSLSNQDYFELYYQIRNIDRLAVKKGSLWRKFIFNSFIYERLTYEFNAEEGW